MLGPLYHLPDAEDRVRALTEAWRVLKPGGWLFAADDESIAVGVAGLYLSELGARRVEPWHECRVRCQASSAIAPH